MDSCVPFRKSRSVGFKSFKSFLTLVTCSQSFLQKHFTIVRLVFFVAEVAQFDFLHTNISSNMLQTPLHCFLKVAIYNLFRYVYYLYTMPPGVLSMTFSIDIQREPDLFHYDIVRIFTNFNIWFKPLELSIKYLVSSVNLDIAVYC